MGHRKVHAPKRGSIAYNPRKRAKYIKGRVRHWLDSSDEINFLGFAGFKAGMTHVMFIEDQKTSAYLGKELMKAVTIVDVPPLILIGIRVYNEDNYGKYVIGDLLAKSFNEHLKRKTNLPNSETYEFEAIKKNLLSKINDTSEIRGIFQTQPYKTPLARKKPDIIEIKINSTGNPLEEFNFAVERLGKEIRARDIFKVGDMIDTISVSKGKGTQSPVKRFHVRILGRKDSKMHRAVAAIGTLHPNRVPYTTPRVGQLGYNNRIEYHKRIMIIGENEEEINPKGGIIRFGMIKGDYLLIMGSIPGPRKRLIRMRKTMRPVKNFTVKAPEITYISRESQQ